MHCRRANNVRGGRDGYEEGGKIERKRKKKEMKENKGKRHTRYRHPTDRKTDRPSKRRQERENKREGKQTTYHGS